MAINRKMQSKFVQSTCYIAVAVKFMEEAGSSHMPWNLQSFSSIILKMYRRTLHYVKERNPQTNQDETWTNYGPKNYYL